MALEQLEYSIWELIVFFSCKFSDTERFCNEYDRELLAIFAAIKFFQRILEGRSFAIRMDHRPLIYMARQRSDNASSHVQRQLDYILQFDVQFETIKDNEDNVVTNALSRT